MKFLRRTSNYIVNHTKSQAIEELKEDQRINKITNNPNMLTITTNPIIPKGFKGDELFIFPVAIFRIKINFLAKQLKSIIHITPGGQLTHPHMYSDGVCWGDFKKELLEMKKHKDWYWMVKRILDFLNDFGTESRQAPIGFGASWVDRRLQMQLHYTKNDPKAKKKLKALNKVYRKKYKIRCVSNFK